MPLGVGAAMLIGSAVAGGTALGAAKIQSNAAKNAAKEQQKGTDRALQVQQQANQPYMDLGKQGVERLMSMGASQPYTQQFQPRGPSMPGQPPPQAPSNGFQAFQPSGPQPQGQPMPTLGSIGQPPQGGLVTLQAPTGETVRMPDGPMVQQALQRGARRLA